MVEEGGVGRFVWHELMTTDPEAAIAFYTDVIGWGTAPWDASGEPYTMWVAGESPVGGVLELPEQARRMGAPPGWMAYVGVNDIGAAAERTRTLGGTVVMPPWEIPTIGRLAVIADCAGAVLALLEPCTPMPAVPPSPGRFSWCELLTPEPEAALRFHADLFGWERMTDMDMGSAGTYHVFGRDGEQWGGVYRPPGAPGPSAWLYYVMVESADAAAERATAAGGQRIHGPADVPGGDRIAVCIDPQGAVFAVHSKAAN